MKVWKRLFAFPVPYRTALAGAVLAMLLLAATTSMYPLLLELLTNLLVEGRDSVLGSLEKLHARIRPVASFFGLSSSAPDFIAFVHGNLIALFVCVVGIKAVSQAVRFFVMGWVAQRVAQDIRRLLFERIMRQGQSFFGQEGTGFLVSRLVNDVGQVERAATYAIPVLLGDVLKVLMLGIVCIVQYPELSLVSLAIVPVAVLPIVYFGRMLKRYARSGQSALGELTNRITETIGGIRVVQTYGREEHEISRFDRDGESYLRLMMKSVLVRALQTPAMELIGVAALFITIFYAMGRIEANEIQPGEVIGFLLALVLLYEPLKAIGRVNGIMVPGLAAAERVFEVVDTPPSVRDVLGAVELVPPVRALAFESVSFAYRQNGPLVLQEVDFTLSPGRIVALVGPSGSGKSTAAMLIPRLFDVTSGRITINGIDLRNLTLRSLREQVAVVAQETFLFNDSIRDNIAYGLTGASDDEIEQASRRANAHDFICSLPKGYDTRAGERGVQLSGGQRQRIAIARAFLRDAPILILDEATSALDVESELEVQRAIDALLVNRAALVIAHRLSTIRAAHEILVMEHGRVVDRGRHEELLQRESVYTRLVRVSEG